MQETEVEQLAELIAKKIIEQQQNELKYCLVDDEDLHTIRDMVKAFKYARGLFWKTFIGLAILGASALALIGLQEWGKK